MIEFLCNLQKIWPQPFQETFCIDRNFIWLSENRIGTAGKIGDDIVKIRYLRVGFMLISQPAIFVCLQSSSRKQWRATTTAQGEVKIIPPSLAYVSIDYLMFGLMYQGVSL